MSEWFARLFEDKVHDCEHANILDDDLHYWQLRPFVLRDVDRVVQHLQEAYKTHEKENLQLQRL